MNNIFISHYSGDVNRLRRLKDLLAKADCEVRNSSAEEDKDGGLIRHGHTVSNATIARYLRAGIRWAGTFVVIIGKETHNRPWVNWEIKNAHDQGKQIIGIYDWNCQDAQLPEAYKRYGGSPIGWGSIDTKLAGMIKGKVPVPEAPDGKPAAPIYNIIHIKC